MKKFPNTNNRSFRKTRGFTLMELLVVITIILILAGLTLGAMKFVTAKQNIEKCKADIALLSRGLEEYKLDYAQYPIEQGTGSQTLFEFLYWDTDSDGSAITQDVDQKIYIAELDPNNPKPKWTQAQGASYRVIDPWLSDMNYRRGTQTDGITPNANAKNPDFDLWSAGPDGRFTPQDNSKEDQDNITNWR